jgi:hypothetical protein
MNLHKFIDELWENGSSNFNLCTGGMGESQSYGNLTYSLVKNKEEVSKYLTKFIIINGYELSLPEYSISGKYANGLLILAISTDLV